MGIGAVEDGHELAQLIFEETADGNLSCLCRLRQQRRDKRARASAHQQLEVALEGVSILVKEVGHLIVNAARVVVHCEGRLLQRPALEEGVGPKGGGDLVQKAHVAALTQCALLVEQRQ